MAGCSVSEDTSYFAPTPEATHSQYLFGSPVDTRLTAIDVGRKLLETKGGIIWIESPRAVSAEEISYTDANRRIGVGEGQYDLWPQETSVWFVIFKGRWQLIPLDPTQAVPQPVTYEGCVFSLFTASDASLISMGDFVCSAN